jgi:hypothetical protein
MKVFVVALILMLLPVVVLSSDRSITVRDRYGNIVETKDRHGNDTTVRDRSGNIIGTEDVDR